MKQIETYLMLCDVDGCNFRQVFHSQPGLKPHENRGNGPASKGWRKAWRPNRVAKNRYHPAYKIDVCPRCVNAMCQPFKWVAS